MTVSDEEGVPVPSMIDDPAVLDTLRPVLGASSPTTWRPSLPAGARRPDR